MARVRRRIPRPDDADVRAVTLPTGGRIWLRTTRTQAMRRAWADVARTVLAIPTSGLVEELVRSRRALDAAIAELLCACVTGSADVRSPGGDEIALPADIEQLDEEDYQALVIEILWILDPRADRRPIQ